MSDLPTLGPTQFRADRCRRAGHALWLSSTAALAILSGAVLAQSTPLPFGGFVENRGQWTTEARFVADFGDLLVRAEAGAIVIQKTVVSDGRALTGVVRMVLEGAEQAEPWGAERASGSFHYFNGQDPARWRTNVPAFQRVMYAIGSGTELELYEKNGHLEYDVRLAPGADLASVIVRCEGVSELVVEPHGGLRLESALGPLRQTAPIARQVRPGGQSEPVSSAFRIFDGKRFGFTAPGRAAGAALIIDPGLTWSTFLGGTAGDWSTRVAVRPDGRLVVVGRTSSANFPVTAGVFSESFSGPADISVTCMEPTGEALVYSTYIGGAEGDVPMAMAIADDGAVAIVGHTSSTDYPVLGDAFDVTANGEVDAFATVLAGDGSALLLSTYLGGSNGEALRSVAFDAGGLIHVAGSTGSPDFPTTASAYDRFFNGAPDGVVAGLNYFQSGSAQLVYATYLGTPGGEEIYDLALNASGEPTVVGLKILSPDFPWTPGAYSQTDGLGFITRLTSDGSALVASTHFPGQVVRVVHDGPDILVAGNPELGLPVSPNAFDSTPNGLLDCFVARLDGDLSQVLAATFLGGSLHDRPKGLAIDPSGAVVVVGSTGSLDYPTTMGAFDVDKGGFPGSLVSMVSYLSPDLSELLYSSYLGPSGSTSNWANDVVALGVADVVIVGEGALTGFPVTPGAYDDTFNGGTLGGGDGYVARMHLAPAWVSLGGAIPGSNGTPSLIGIGTLWGGQPVTIALSRAKPSTAVTLVLGLRQLGTAFKGGALWPSPDFIIAGLSTDTHGLMSLGATWPVGLPSGFTFVAQCWIADPAGPAGFAASNGLSGVCPSHQALGN